SEHVRPFLDLIGADRNKWGIKRAVGDGAGEHGPAVEVYCSGRYFAVTGQLWPGKPDSVVLFDWSSLEQLSRAIPMRAGRKPGSGGTGKDNTRSALAFRKGAELGRHGATLEEMCETLRTDPDPDIVIWVREKGESNHRRELNRICQASVPVLAA